MNMMDSKFIELTDHKMWWDGLISLFVLLGGIFVPVSKPDLEVLSPNNLNCPLMQNIIRTAFHNPHVTKDRLFLEKLLSMYVIIYICLWIDQFLI